MKVIKLSVVYYFFHSTNKLGCAEQYASLFEAFILVLYLSVRQDSAQSHATK